PWALPAACRTSAAPPSRRAPDCRGRRRRYRSRSRLGPRRGLDEPADHGGLLAQARPNGRQGVEALARPEEVRAPRQEVCGASQHPPGPLARGEAAAEGTEVEIALRRDHLEA